MSDANQTLERALTARAGYMPEPDYLRRFLRWSYCRPRKSGHRRNVEQWLPNAELFVEPEPGETLLLATAQHNASLWVLRPARPDKGDGEFTKDCLDQLRRAKGLVSRDLPLLSNPEDPAEWTAVLLKPNQNRILEGDSFGLSFCLATASLMLQLPLPDDLVASAGVNSAGSLKEVDAGGLRKKLTALVEWTPNIRRVLVAMGQTQAAEEIAASLDPAPQVLGVKSVGQALAIAFPNLIEHASRRWAEPDVRAAVVHRLFHQVNDNSASLLTFSGMANACEKLAEFYPGDSEEFVRLEFARAVALGHDGSEISIPFRRAWLETLDKGDRKRALSHMVSRSLYATPSERDELIGYVENEISQEPKEADAEDWQIWGAVGRVLAPLGEYQRAAVYLRRATRGWKRRREINSVSYALSEWVRVVGLQSAAGQLPDLLEAEVTPVLRDPSLSLSSRAFLIFAVARAWAQLGDYEQCLRWFRELDGGIDWAHTASHLRASRLRWEALASRQRDDPRAADLKSELQALAAEDKDAQFAWVLCQLDGILLGDDGAISVLFERFLKLEPKAFKMATAQSASDSKSDRARALTRHYPY